MNEKAARRARLRAACCSTHALGSDRALLQHVDRIARVIEAKQIQNNGGNRA